MNGHLIGYRKVNGTLVEDRERNVARRRQEPAFLTNPQNERAQSFVSKIL